MNCCRQTPAREFNQGHSTPVHVGEPVDTLEYAVLLLKNILFIIRSFTILVLTTVLCRPRHADAKNDVKIYQVSTTSMENAIWKFPRYIFLNFSVIMT